MTVRSDRLVYDSRTYLLNSQVLLGTVPAGERWVLKDISVLVYGAPTTGFALRVHDGGAGSGVSFFYVPVTGLVQVTDSGRFVVARAGDTITGNIAGSGGLEVLIAGARLAA